MSSDRRLPALPLSHAALAALAFALAAFALLASGCISTRPCEGGGDVSWEPTIKGDRHCHQKRHPKTQRWVNHGQFRQFDEKGQKRVEGMYKLGEKDGIWIQYAEDGKKIKEKYFEDGVEKSVPPEIARKLKEEREAAEGPQRPPDEGAPAEKN
ncbi:MAG: hypothetical protein IT285_09800 [Bdellovibrionales bacterium]|nr:hypothetical protein [Bdellovibrionales bacterium]